MVIQLGDYHLVAGAPGPAERPREVEGEGRHVGAEGDLLRRRVEKLRQRFPGTGQHPIGFLAGRVGPMCIGVVVQEVVVDGFNHRQRHLGAAGAIEVGHGAPALDPAQGGKLRSDAVQGHRHGLVAMARRRKAGKGVLRWRLVQEAAAAAIPAVPPG